MNFDFQSFLGRKKMKQREAADILGCSMGFVGMMASGKSKPSYETIIKLIDAGITVRELFGEEYAAKIIENSNIDTCKMPSKKDFIAFSAVIRCLSTILVIA